LTDSAWSRCQVDCGSDFLLFVDTLRSWSSSLMRSISLAMPSIFCSLYEWWVRPQEPSCEKNIIFKKNPLLTIVLILAPFA
jgi:hypothetical protein